MAGLDPAIHEKPSRCKMDPRVKPGDDVFWCGPPRAGIHARRHHFHLGRSRRRPDRGRAGAAALTFASASLGAGAFLALIKAARAAVPGVAVEAVLDCGDAPGHALGALRLGAEAISLTAPDEVMQKIAEIAAQTGAKLYRASPDGQLHAMLPASSTHP